MIKGYYETFNELVPLSKREELLDLFESTRAVDVKNSERANKITEIITGEKPNGKKPQEYWDLCKALNKLKKHDSTVLTDEGVDSMTIRIVRSF